MFVIAQGYEAKTCHLGKKFTSETQSTTRPYSASHKTLVDQPTSNIARIAWIPENVSLILGERSRSDVKKTPQSTENCVTVLTFGRDRPVGIETRRDRQDGIVATLRRESNHPHFGRDSRCTVGSCCPKKEGGVC